MHSGEISTPILHAGNSHKLQKFVKKIKVSIWYICGNPRRFFSWLYFFVTIIELLQKFFGFEKKSLCDLKWNWERNTRIDKGRRAQEQMRFVCWRMRKVHLLVKFMNCKMIARNNAKCSALVLNDYYVTNVHLRVFWADKFSHNFGFG